MVWHPITTSEEATAFLSRVGDFHDACLREAHLWTGHFVSDDLAMAIDPAWDTRIRLLIQRQARPLSAVELLFQEVRGFYVAPSPPDYESIIYSATLAVDGDSVYWADRAGWALAASDRDESTWVWAGRMHWRDASDWMGEPLHYGPAGSAPPAA